MMPTLKYLYTSFLPLQHPTSKVIFTYEALQLTPYSRDHSRSCSWSAYKLADERLAPLIFYHNPEDHKVKHTLKGIQESTIDDPQMDFYRSDDNSSDSEEDLDHLN